MWHTKFQLEVLWFCDFTKPSRTTTAGWYRTSTDEMEGQNAYLPGLKQALRDYLNAENGVLDVLVEMYGSAADAVKNMKPVNTCLPFVHLVHACKDQYFSKMDDADVKAACSEQYKGPNVHTPEPASVAVAPLPVSAIEPRWTQRATAATHRCFIAVLKMSDRFCPKVRKRAQPTPPPLCARRCRFAWRQMRTSHAHISRDST